MRPATRLRRRLVVLAAAVTPVLTTVADVHATGTFDGGQVAAVRLWDAGGANPGINWVADTLPVPGVDAITFDASGDGTVDMNGVLRSHPGLGFKNWVSYTLTSGTFGLTGAAPAITVGASVSSTYGSDYFADGTSITAGLSLGPAAQANTIAFIHPDTGILRLMGPLSGAGSLTLTRAAGASNIRGVYYDTPNGGYTGTTTITTGTAARLLAFGRTGTGPIALQGGGVDVLSDFGAQAVTNTFSSVSGTIRADHNYTFGPMPPFAPGVTHILGMPGIPLTVDNPTLIGGTNDASVSFTANNGYNFGVYAMALANAPAIPAFGTRTVSVDNGLRTGGFAGSTRLTGTNRLNEMVVTTTVGPPGGGAPTFFDFNPATGGGFTLSKIGTGVLAIEGVNGGSSTGPKSVLGGVLRFNTAASVGAGFVTLAGGPGPVSSGLGVGYSSGFPVPFLAPPTSAIPGQSGAFDIDTPAYVAAFAPAFGGTAIRLGSSGAGTISGAGSGIGAYAPTATYYLGGGGGTLTIGAGPALAAGGATVQMGTTGFLLPGRVNLMRPVITAAPVNIRAGTLQVMAAGLIGSGGGMPGTVAATSLGAYSTTLGIDGSYGGAPAGTPYNGPGQLLLDATVQAGGGYVYTPGGPPTHFGFGGLMLDGGAIGYTPGGAVPAVVPIFAPPVPAGFGGVPPPGSLGTWGATLASTLYTSAFFPGPAVATNILHFGGEYSTGGIGAGAITPFFGIADNGPTPVALIKSGVDSTLDLTAVPFHPHTGGTAILGGEVVVNMPGQLGAGGIAPPVVVIADGGVLHVVPGGGAMVPFPQVLRVANGPATAAGGRASRINVDAGIVADFSASPFEASAAGSVLEKLGPGGSLQFLPPFLYPSTPGNTWGLKATEGPTLINQLPGTLTPSNGSAIFDGGAIFLVGSADPGFIAIPAATQYAPNYGFSGLQTFAGTGSTLSLGDKSFFRITGAQTSSLMGSLTVPMGVSSVFKIAGNALGDDTRGTGSVTFGIGPAVGMSAVQFTPGGGNILWPRDAAFTTTLNFGTLFSGCPDADINGNLNFNTAGGSPVCFIDAATVDNTPTATVSVWTVGGTGSTSWNTAVVKWHTEAVPGSGGPFVSGTVNFNRAQGAPVSIAAGSFFDIEFGIVNAGDTGDPFTDTSSFTHLPITNNAIFNITAGSKHVASIGGIGATTVAFGARLDVGSSGPVTQGTFTVSGTADVGDVNVSGATTVGASPARLDANYVRGGSLAIGSGTVFLKDSGAAGGVSHVGPLTIAAGGHLDIRDNHVITSTAVGVWGGASYSGITGLIASGRNGGGWGGSGIITSETNATSGSFTSIGIATAQQVKGLALPGDTAVWAGRTVTGSETLVMYTYGGDANLDGKINVDDYGHIDSSIGIGLKGWFNGDFNYDGTINVDDYGIIDFNIGIQGAPFFTAAGAPGQPLAAVPEPATAVLLITCALPLMMRRRSRRACGDLRSGARC